MTFEEMCMVMHRLIKLKTKQRVYNTFFGHYYSRNLEFNMEI